jgi:hypothetical protein
MDARTGSDGAFFDCLKGRAYLGLKAKTARQRSIEVAEQRVGKWLGGRCHRRTNNLRNSKIVTGASSTKLTMCLSMALRKASSTASSSMS